MAAMAATPIGDEVAHFHFDIFMATRDEPTNTQVFAAQDTTEAMCAVLVSYCTSMNVFAASFRGKKIIWRYAMLVANGTDVNRESLTAADYINKLHFPTVDCQDIEVTHRCNATGLMYASHKRIPRLDQRPRAQAKAAQNPGHPWRVLLLGAY
uniref:Uncharacterized protein n=1 Tax=Globodera rostochiensis TaxID=31243 RepID=A0A914HVS4_GLORO